MTRRIRISLITAVAGATLAFAAPASADRWYEDRTPQAGVAVSPDVIERAVLARERSSRIGATVSPDAFERAVAAGRGASGVGGAYADAHGRSLGQGQALGFASDAFERAVSAGRPSPASTPGISPDTFERTVLARQALGGTPVDDHHARMQPLEPVTPVSATGSARDVEWPQVGIGFGLGILLGLGLLLGTRLTRTRPLAH